MECFKGLREKMEVVESLGKGAGEIDSLMGLGEVED